MQTLTLEPRRRCITLPPLQAYTQFLGNVCLISSGNRDFVANGHFFDFAPYKYSCLLTMDFVVDNIYGSFINNMCY